MSHNLIHLEVNHKKSYLLTWFIELKQGWRYSMKYYCGKKTFCLFTPTKGLLLMYNCMEIKRPTSHPRHHKNWSCDKYCFPIEQIKFKAQYCDVIVKLIVIINLVKKDDRRVIGNYVTTWPWLTPSFTDDDLHLDDLRLHPVLLDSDAVSRRRWWRCDCTPFFSSL